jgi:hypothetical protein
VFLQESAKTTANIHPFSTVGRGQGQVKIDEPEFKGQKFKSKQPAEYFKYL